MPCRSKRVPVGVRHQMCVFVALHENMKERKHQNNE